MAKKKKKPDKKDQSFEEIIKEGEKEIKKSQEKEKDDTEKTRQEVKKEPKESAIDPDELKEEIKKEAKEEVAKEVTDKLVKTLKGEEKPDRYVSPWEKRGETQPKDWEEANRAAAERVKYELRKEAEVLKKQEAEKKESDQETKKQMNRRWDDQLEELRKKKYIPQVDPKIRTKLSRGDALSEEEKKDPGLMAQRGLFSTMLKTNKQRVADGRNTITDLFHVYSEYYKDRNKKPAGAKAPVSAGKKVKSTPGSDELNYEEIKSKSFEEILREG